MHLDSDNISKDPGLFSLDKETSNEINNSSSYQEASNLRKSNVSKNSTEYPKMLNLISKMQEMPIRNMEKRSNEKIKSPPNRSNSGCFII